MTQPSTVTSSTDRSRLSRERAGIERVESSPRYRAAMQIFQPSFLQQEFGLARTVCDKRWLDSSLRDATSEHADALALMNCQATDIKLCSNCARCLTRGKIPPSSVSNGFYYPPKPVGLPPLNADSPPAVPSWNLHNCRSDHKHASSRPS